MKYKGILRKYCFAKGDILNFRKTSNRLSEVIIQYGRERK
jgi:hypothetical protein